MEVVAREDTHRRNWACAWSPDGARLAVCGTGPDVCVYAVVRGAGSSAATLRAEAVLRGGHGRTVRSVAWAPCGRVLALGSFDGRVTVWRRTAGGGGGSCSSVDAGDSRGCYGNTSVTRCCQEESASATGCCQEERVSTAGCCGEDSGSATGCCNGNTGTTRCCRGGNTGAKTNSRSNSALYVCAASLEGHESEVKRVAWSADGRFLATCGRDKAVWVWQRHADEAEGHAMADDDAASFECVCVAAEHAGDVKGVVFDAGRGLLASCGYDDALLIWAAVDAAGEDDWRVVARHSAKSTVWDASFCGVYLATAEGDGTVRVLRRRDSLGGSAPWEYDVAHVLGASPLSVYSLSLSSGSLVCGGRDRVLRRLAIGTDGTASVVAALALPAEINCVRHCPADSRLAAVCGDDGLLALVSLS